MTWARSGSAEHAAAVTPSDSADLPGGPATFLYVGGTGSIKVTTVGGEDVTFSAVPVGILPIAVKRVWSTGTAATNLVACW